MAGTAAAFADLTTPFSKRFAVAIRRINSPPARNRSRRNSARTIKVAAIRTFTSSAGERFAPAISSRTSAL